MRETCGHRYELVCLELQKRVEWKPTGIKITAETQESSSTHIRVSITQWQTYTDVVSLMRLCSLTEMLPTEIVVHLHIKTKHYLLLPCWFQPSILLKRRQNTTQWWMPWHTPKRRSGWPISLKGYCGYCSSNGSNRGRNFRWTLCQLGQTNESGGARFVPLVVEQTSVLAVGLRMLEHPLILSSNCRDDHLLGSDISFDWVRSDWRLNSLPAKSWYSGETP